MLKYNIKVDWQQLEWGGEDGYVSWLKQNVGEYITDWDYDDDKFYFKNPEDAIMFTMRWA
jgi:hypothetical protein